MPIIEGAILDPEPTFRVNQFFWSLIVNALGDREFRSRSILLATNAQAALCRSLVSNLHELIFNTISLNRIFSTVIVRAPPALVFKHVSKLF